MATNYYENVKYPYQPYSVTGTPFGTPTGPYPTTTNVEQNAGNPGFNPIGGVPPSGTTNNPNNPNVGPGSTTPAGGLFHPPNWLTQPQDATVRAMRMAGYNPGSFNPVSQQILRNAGNLQAQLFGQVAGSNDISDFTNEEAMLGKLQAMIQQGAAGGKIFGGIDPSRMANFSRWTAASNAGTDDPNANAIAQYLYNNGDPSNAMRLSQSLLYSGLAPQFQTAAAAPMANLADYYQRLLEQGQDYERTFIDVLLGAPVYGHPAGSPGVPLPFQASAWRYNP